ncbi:MAG: molybdopterin-dependent oxidoreductase Mo/Fe-S-binding subunit [Spirochaetota bacterium]
MNVACRINGKERSFEANPSESVQQVLSRLGYITVRNSDDGEGFCGSDTILVDDVPQYASLLRPFQIEGKQITTAESLVNGRHLSVVQQAMVDAGVVQSGYNAPAAALLLTSLLEEHAHPSTEQISDALSGLFNRATGYKQFFQAVRIAEQRLANPDYTEEIAPEFRDDLRQVGKVRQKIDGKKLVAGWKSFVEDMVEPGTSVLRMLRSPHAHAYISRIDTSQAEQLPGVLAVITHKNCPDVYYGTAGQGFPEPSPYDRRMFNKKVRHVGDRVAAVVAESDEIAAEALNRIEVDYEVLQPIFSIDQAMQPDSPLVHNGLVEYVSGAPEDLDGYNESADPRDGKVVYQFPIHGDIRHNIAAAASGSIGDVQTGFAAADTVIERTYETSQVQCTPLETHISYAKFDGDRLILHASTQVPWHLRRIVATALGISENMIQVIKERVGGGYGSKQDILLEDVTAYAASITGTPVLYRFSRAEEFTANSTRLPMKIGVKLGCDKTGKLTAVSMDVKANTGPYGSHCLTVPMNACSKSLPLLMCEHMQFQVTSYYSNIPPTGAYQGYGAPKGSFALMTAMGELAAQMNMDLVKLLEINRVRDDSLLEILKCLGEGREGTAVRVKSCGLGPALQQGAHKISWDTTEHSDIPHEKIGKGVAIIQQGSGLPGLDHSCAEVKMLSDGSFMLHSGGADLGTGLDTVSVKFAAEVLQVDMERVSILSGDTDNTPFDTGAYASSGTFFSGGASKKAAEQLKQKILQAASGFLDEPVEHLHIEYPGLVKDSYGNEISYREIAQRTQSGTGSGQLTGYASFTTEDASFPYGAHFCQVAVNERTGEIRVQKYIALQDCGTPVNPELALGQIYGGVLKTIGHSLSEQMVLDQQGTCLTTTMRTYGVPMISEMPDTFEAVLIPTDDPYGPFGSKSVSEISCNGAAPAISIAIHDAVGVWMRDWPFTPEKLLRALGKI